MSVGVEDWGKVLLARTGLSEKDIHLVGAWETATHIRAQYVRGGESRFVLLPKDFAASYQASDLDEMVYRAFSES